MNAQQLKNSILQEAIEGRLVPQDPNDEPASVLLEKIRKEKAKLVKDGKLILSKPEKKVNNKEVEDLNLPETWTWCQINDICRTFGRIGFRGYTKDDLRSSPKDGAITLSPTNINNGTIDLTSCTYLSWEKYEESPEIQVAEGDIILVKTASIGKCALINEVKHEMTVNPQFVVLKDIKIFNKYLFYLILSPYVQDKIKNYAIGTSIPTYSQVSLISMKIPLPPLAEQKRIVAKIEELLPKVEAYGKAQDSLDKLNEELPERLKKSILQEAIEGRLVPQDPNDEPASVLLDKIRKEKAKLVKEGKLKKKDLEEVPIGEDEKLFEIPKSWEWCRLKDVTNKIVDGDHNPPRGLSYDTKYYMLSSKNINNNKVEGLSDVRCISLEDWKKCNERTQLSKGDVLLTTVATLGRSCVYEDDVPYCFQRSVSIISTMIFNYYLKFCFDSPFYQSQIDDKATGTAQRGFYLNQLEESIIPLPPLSEQHRIVAKIEQLLHEIDKLKA